ncbi:SWI/SNF-related matrix-associated actin-dependent regulator of chromatin subfamily B member 1 [Thelohanellus kitauei]|uniref:SWI/SNF-related matrix-associated actin-dependent regulator of chromatin subfamily B member 1 n=1 Tax=Thelohanellus kitauei TaxID=669202 RepID=A0A0C2NAD6_THEKT|nr:SWI/SNF-related matrix-associated actin-dependent regulator of chromatin subfamily B member 1 [Thelohanellus kitauei]
MAGENTGFPSVINLDGQDYMIGSEVGYYLNIPRGEIYRKYPGLKRRQATSEERKKIIELHPCNTYASSSRIFLLKSEEVMDIIKGDDEKYGRLSLSCNFFHIQLS